MTQNASGLTEQQLGILRAKLQTEKARIIGATRVSGDTKDREVGDEMDVADQVSETEEKAARNDRDAARLSQIEAALAKFDTGEYGISADSGEPIGFARLEAIPWARLTVREEEEIARAR
ncbi:MAG TPA: TraR/DksA family transcriptional regulator [Polyangiaceae bacterium]|nr:TraR/DksA family transcriptional regulator [Polyangiaceae bacterium]